MPAASKSMALNVYGRLEKIVTPRSKGKTMVTKSTIGLGDEFRLSDAYRAYDDWLMSNAVSSTLLAMTYQGS